MGGGVYDISNKRRMGLTEYQAVKEMQDGILELINIEKSMTPPEELAAQQPCKTLDEPAPTPAHDAEPEPAAEPEPYDEPKPVSAPPPAIEAIEAQIEMVKEVTPEKKEKKKKKKSEAKEVKIEEPPAHVPS